MCPNCIRGLTKDKQVCAQCAGTGFWNPESLSVKDVEIMDEQENAPVGASEGEASGVETPAVEATDTASTAPASVDAPTTAEEVSVQAPNPEVLPEDQVNG